MASGTAQGDAQTRPDQTRPDQTRPNVIGLDPSDLIQVGIGGDWSPETPDFSGLMASSSDEGGAYIYSALFDWSDGGASTLSATTQSFADEATATAAFQALLPRDEEVFGAVVGPVTVGSEGRLLRQDDTTTVRWRTGQYVARVSNTSETPIPVDRLIALARHLSTIMPTLAGEMFTPPVLASFLPPAGDEAAPELGNAAGPSDWWVWAIENDEEFPSQELREELRRGVGAAQAVMRGYGVPSLPGHYATVTIMPFKDPTAARHYIDTTMPDEIKTDPRHFTLQPPDPKADILPWRADVLYDRYVIEVDCLSEEETTQKGCGPVVRRLTERTLDLLQGGQKIRGFRG